MSDQPKPTTGEWTMERLESYRVHGGFRAYKLLEDINAALAAESQKWQRVWTDRYETLAQTTQQLRKQLAAAVREAILNDVGAEGSEYIVKLEQQLADEREHVAALQRLEGTLQEQLAAEREKVQTLTDAIKSHNDWVLNNDDVQQQCYLITLSDHP